ncbi:MAG: hypothetical protein HY721_02260 [Planctomycetes bacterium]|nr:hypothetical protein [Planctomycetota bacterium]
MVKPIRSFIFLAALAAPVGAQVCNVKVVTDASPDFSDLESFLHSATSRWETPAEQCWALFYWMHIGRRQTSPMVLHGLEVTDPIRQLNDHGYAMCSTVAGMNCAAWDALGLPVRLWDITLHTVSEVEYGGRWHMYDFVLNLRQGEEYTRHYASLGTTSEHYVPNGGKDPESVNPR